MLQQLKAHVSVGAMGGVKFVFSRAYNRDAAAKVRYLYSDLHIHKEQRGIALEQLQKLNTLSRNEFVAKPPTQLLTHTFFVIPLCLA